MMANKTQLMAAVRGLRDELHDRLDDNVTDRVFKPLRLRHVAAVIQARREVEDPSLPATSAKYAPVVVALGTATAAVAAAESTDEPAMLAATAQAKAATDQVAALP